MAITAFNASGLQALDVKIPASGTVALSGDTPALTWRQKVYPSSGGGKSISGGAGAENWGNWINIGTPPQNFEIVKVEAHLKQKDAYYIEVGESGQSTTDVVHLECVESGTVVVDTLNPPKRGDSGDDISARAKSQRGSGIESTIWVFTREAT